MSFLRDLKSRLLSRVLITSDGHNVYAPAVEKVFGAEVDHVILYKEVKSWRDRETRSKNSRVKWLDKVPQNGTKVDLSLASTSLVERLNASLRNFVTAYARDV